MSLAKPLVRFQNIGRAELISSSSMPKKTKTSKTKSRAKSTASRKPRVVKGRINLRVAGYSGVQKLAPSSLIPYLPITKLRLAAKKALAATGKKSTRKIVRKRKNKRQ